MFEFAFYAPHPLPNRCDAVSCISANGRGEEIESPNLNTAEIMIMELPPLRSQDPIAAEAVRSRGQAPDPTPEEIEAACAEIRKSWSEDEKLIRARGQDRHES